MQPLGTFQTPFGEAEAFATSYAADSTLAIVLHSALTGEPLAKLSLHEDYSPHLPKGHFIAKTYSENEPLVQPALASTLFEDTGELSPSGFPIWRIRQDLIL